MDEIRQIDEAAEMTGTAIDDLADSLVEYLEALNQARGTSE